jgi:hypothetical protein
MTSITYKGVTVSAVTDPAPADAEASTGPDGNGLLLNRDGKTVLITWTAPAGSGSEKAIDIAFIMQIIEMILKLLGLFGGAG